MSCDFTFSIRPAASILQTLALGAYSAENRFGIELDQVGIAFLIRCFQPHEHFLDVIHGGVDLRDVRPISTGGPA